MAYKRIRGRKLQEIRARYFAKNPLCVHCLAKGIIKFASELDHIKAIDNGGQDNESNRQGLCASCHKAKTDQDMGYRERIEVGIDGYPLGGG